MQLVYTGPSPAVDIAGGYHAVKGQPFEVPDELGESLLEQDTFKKPKKKTSADPAAPTTSEEE